MTTLNPISAVREGTGFTRATVGVVLTTFLALILSPTAAAAREVLQDPARLLGQPATVAESDKLNDALKSVKATLQRMDVALQKGSVPSAELKTLAGLKATLVEADGEVLDAFDRDLAHIKKHKLPEVIQQRHAAALAEYKTRHREMLSHLGALAAAQGVTALKAKTKAATEWLGKQQLEPKPAPFDPNKLGFQVETKKARAPKLTAKELKQIAPPVIPAKAGIQSSSLFGAPIQVASIGSMSGLLAASAITAPGPEYLLPTTDIQITPEIQALAATLHHHPVEIHNWVRNNIEWIPTYGSVQGSALTLDKKAGNAFDTASLLIALLRASNIPARYVYGTIQVPIDKAMNWAGGFTHPDAVQTFLATGGIPNTALTSGGVTKFIRMEHVWVEAFVDFYPSRGVKNLAPDTWVPMDASFKQYTYTDGLDLQAGVPFDAQDFLTSAQEGATVNEQEGWVQNLNQANIQTRLTQYQQQLQSFIESQSPDATVGEVLGAKTIQQLHAPVLAASLPYPLVATGNRYSALPDSLRHKFQYSLYQDAYQRSIENPLWTYTESTPNLASKKVTLSFVPASDADRQTIESYLPKPHEDGSPIQPEEFPSSLPAYNIRVTAELRVEGNVVARGGTFTLGTEILGEGGFTYLHNLSDWDLTLDRHVSGQTSAVALSLLGVSATQLAKHRTTLEQLRSHFSTAHGRSDVLRSTSGDVLTAAAWTYFAAVERLATSLAQITTNANVSGLSYGVMHGRVKPTFRYGLVTSVRYDGALTDIGHQRRVSFSRSGSMAQWIAFNRVVGMQSSATEHVVPERILSNPANPIITVSAVKALSLAYAAGQRVFTITRENESVVGRLQQSEAVLQNIRNAVSAGKEVTVHERPVITAGFSGAGYLIIDPSTGAGSYLIEGGANGDDAPCEGQQDAKLCEDVSKSFLLSLLEEVNDAVIKAFAKMAGWIALAEEILDLFVTCKFEDAYYVIPGFIWFTILISGFSTWLFAALIPFAGIGLIIGLFVAALALTYIFSQFMAGCARRNP